MRGRWERKRERNGEVPRYKSQVAGSSVEKNSYQQFKSPLAQKQGGETIMLHQRRKRLKPT